MNKFYHVGTLARRDVTALLHTLTLLPPMPRGSSTMWAAS